MIADNELAGMLLDARLIDHDNLDQAIILQTRHGGDLYSVVIENGLVDEERTIQVVANRLNMSCVSLRDFEADAATLHLLSPELAIEHRVVPLGLSEDQSVFLAMANPIDLDAMQAVAAATGRDVIALLAGPLDIERTLERVYETPRRPSATMLGSLFTVPGASLDDELEDVLSLPSLDDDDDVSGLANGFVVNTESVEAEDVLDLYGTPRERMFDGEAGFFVAADGLSDEGRKRLAEAARVEDLEAVRPGKGKTEGFRGWDDDEEIEPANVDRGLFNLKGKPRLPAAAVPLPPPPPRSTPKTGPAPKAAPPVPLPSPPPRANPGTGPAPRAAGPAVPPPAPQRPRPTPPPMLARGAAPAGPAQPAVPPPSESRRLFPRRELTVSGAQSTASASASADRPSLGASMAPPGGPAGNAPRIGASIGELPREKRDARRVGRFGASSSSARNTREIDPFENLEARDLVLALVKGLIKKGILTPQDILAELPGADD